MCNRHVYTYEHMQHIDFLAIGDIVTDAFIRIKDANVTCEVDEHDCKLSLRFGDKVPYESVEEIRAVGNSANAAVAAARLGLSSALIANVGNDTQGHNCVTTLTQNGVETHYVRFHDGIPTNYHYVLWYDVDRTILVKHASFPYIFPGDVAAPKMIYLSSLGENSLEYHQQIAAFVSAHPETKLVFQPGTFQMKIGTEALKEIYSQTYAFFCNLEEAQRITQTESSDVRVLFKKLHALGPKLVFITDSINGAYGSDGIEAWFIPAYPHAPYERTGAGDAFASAVSVALLMGKSVPDAMVWGPINSMSVVQYVGAQKGLLTQEKIAQYIAEAPADYAPRELF